MWSDYNLANTLPGTVNIIAYIPLISTWTWLPAQCTCLPTCQHTVAESAKHWPSPTTVNPDFYVVKFSCWNIFVGCRPYENFSTRKFFQRKFHIMKISRFTVYTNCMHVPYTLHCLSCDCNWEVWLVDGIMNQVLTYTRGSQFCWGRGYSGPLPIL